MSQAQDDAEIQVLKLPRDARARIVLHLLESLEQEQSSASRSEAERAWVEESLQRLDAYRRGEMEARPADEVIAELESEAD